MSLYPDIGDQCSQLIVTCHMASEKFDAELLHNITSFYLTSYVTDTMEVRESLTSTMEVRESLTSMLTQIILLTDVFSSPFINRSVNILREFWRFCQSSEHRFPPCLHPELSTTWNDHSYSNVQVSIFVTCLNFAGTGSRLW